MSLVFFWISSEQIRLIMCVDLWNSFFFFQFFFKFLYHLESKRLLMITGNLKTWGSLALLQKVYIRMIYICMIYIKMIYIWIVYNIQCILYTVYIRTVYMWMIYILERSSLSFIRIVLCHKIYKSSNHWTILHMIIC